MKGKATITRKQKGSRETSTIVVQKPYAVRLREEGAKPARTTRRSWLPRLFRK